jgi:hypothetical protein
MEQPPKEIFWVSGNRSRLYMNRGHLKSRIKHRGLWSARVLKLELGSSEWMDVTEEFKGESS